MQADAGSWRPNARSSDATDDAFGVRAPERIGERRLAFGVLALTVLVYAWSLSGDWIWDDVYQYRDNPAITHPWVLVTNDIWGPTGEGDPQATPVYRPLAMVSHVPGQLLLRGPAVERLVNLALHLLVVAVVAALVRGLGAGPRAAWFGAACLAWHPAATESVAWISARGDLMGTALVLVGMLAVQRDRPGLAGASLALAPFCKETFVLAPLALGIWMLALRRRSLLAPGLAIAGVAAYLGVRRLLGIALPSGAGASDVWELLGAAGAVAMRGVELLLVPTAPEALPAYALRPIAGVAASAAAILGLAALPGRPALGALLGPASLLALAIPASLANGLVADRYFYVACAGCAVAAGLGYAALEVRRGLTPLLFLAPLLLAPFAAARAGDWVSNRDLFGASLARRPDDPEALFHVAYDLHVAQGDCRAAVPLYRRAMPESPRAGNNLQACLFALGRLEEAAALGPELAARDPRNATPALNTGRALLALARPEEALPWAVEGVRCEPDAARAQVLLGNVLGTLGRHADALARFQRALEIAPGDPDALRGAGVARRHLSGAHTSVRDARESHAP